MPGPSRPQELYHDLLRDLDIGFWTTVPISDELAARVVSAYHSLAASEIGRD